MAHLRGRKGMVLGGLGKGLAEWAQMLLKEKFAEEQQARQNQFVSDRQKEGRRTQSFQHAMDLLAANPEKAGMIRNMAANNPDLEGMDLQSTLTIPDTDLLRPLTGRIQGAKTLGEANFDIPALAKSLGVQQVETPTPFTETRGDQVAQASEPSPQIAALMKQARERSQFLEGEKEAEIKEKGQIANVEALERGRGTNQATAEFAPTARTNKGLEETQSEEIKGKQGQVNLENQFKFEHAPPQVKAEAGLAGAKTGAEAAARYPWEAKLAQTRADTALLNQKAMDDYKKAHPAATAEQLNRAHKAIAADSMIDSEIMPMAEELNKRGLLGALVGRFDNLAAGTLKSSEVFKRPEDAQLVARFVDSSKLLASLVANVHGGQRAVSTKQVMAYFQSIFNGVGDMPILKGQLGSIHRLMDLYQEKPDAPDLFPIPGMDFTQAWQDGGSQGPKNVSPSTSSILNR